MTQKFLILTLSLLLISSPAFAKKDKQPPFQNPRLQNLSSEEKEMFSALTKSQQKNISLGKIETGYNAWMVQTALGSPYYTSENHPIYRDYEEVWLYTKNVVTEDKNEERIIDPTNNWPSIHRIVRTKTCKVGDFFLLYDRGVVDKIVKDNSNKIYGSCTISTTEEFIPLVDGKPVKH